jgi:hypothetical protein
LPSPLRPVSLSLPVSVEAQYSDLPPTRKRYFDKSKCSPFFTQIVFFLTF